MGDAGSFDGGESSERFFKEPEDCLTPPLIAIVGIGLRLPGGVNSTASLWELLINRKDGRSLVPSDRYNVDAFHKPSKTMGSVASQYGYFLRDNISKFDASFFSMSKAEAEKMDPQQRLLLEVVWECMQSGGQKDWRGGNIGCYVGVFGDDWLDMGAKDAQNYGLYRVSGSESLGVSNRISYEYDLKGPSMTIRTGCSSSLLALHEACKAIAVGDCSSALVAGSNLILTPTMTMAMTEQGVLSPEGISKSFDASADGYARGEGINAVYIKKLSDAIRDGDQIRAVIRATATNSDGRTAGISMPSPEAHEAMIRHAYDIAGIENFSDTAFVECHATGTAIGDPLEASAIARVFGGKDGVFIGSIKPNIGHGEGASGLSSLIKAVLALENKTIPPNIHFSTPNPKIPFEASNLRVPVEAIAWPKHKLERASINSFGIGGANAHVILESAAFHGVRVQPKEVTSSNRPHLFLFSASDSKTLQQQIQDTGIYIENHPQCLVDVSYTLALHRDHLLTRGFGVKAPGEPLQVSSFHKVKKAPDVVFIMTGQGAQWAGMGRELARDFPSFLVDIREMQRALATVPHPPKWDILDELLKPESESLLARSEYAQPLCTAIQLAMINILRSWGVKPVAVIGHSSGEIASAFASGSITADEAIKIAYYRGLGTRDVNRPGGMAAVGLGKHEVNSFLREGVAIACDNSPQSVTLSGDIQALSDIMEEIKDSKPDAFLRKLRVEMAYHSYHMKGIGKAYEASLDSLVDAKEVVIPFYSSVTGQSIAEKGALGASYWRKNLESPVLFYSAVTSYLSISKEDSLFVEIGPHSALGGPLRQIFKEAKVNHDLSYAACLERNKDCALSILQLAGQLYQRSVPIDISAIIPTASTLNDLPNYPWAHDVSYWSETRAVRDWRLRKHARHELLGSRIVEGTDLEPTWRNMFNLEDVSWMRDHRINNDIVYPAAAYICMAGAACHQLTGIDDYTVRDFVIKTALVLKDDVGLEVLTSLQPVRLTDSLYSDWYEFRIASFNGVWIQHCTGQVRAGEDLPRKIVIEDFPRNVVNPYQGFKSVGLNYGRHFQGLKGVTASPSSKTAASIVAAPAAKIQDIYQLHPTSIDCSLQLFMIAASEGVARRMTGLFVPTGFSQLYIGKSIPNAEFRAESRCSTYTSTSITGNAIMTSADGNVVFSLQNCRFSPVEADITEEDNAAGAKLHWKPDIDLSDIHNLIRPLLDDKLREEWLVVERLTIACMFEIAYRLSCFRRVATSNHLDKFAMWISSRIRTTSEANHPLHKYQQNIRELTSVMRCSRIEELFSEGVVGSASAAAVLVKRIFDNSLDLFSGHIEPLQVLLPGEGLTRFYDALDGRSDRTEFYACVGHSNPRLRILEIGSGTGGTTSQVLNSLIDQSGSRMYSSYTYTDISSGFFTKAKERFTAVSGIEFKILDITKDPATQGFEGEQFDLIIAANVLHATPNLHETLCNVYKLCAPGGRLFLQELSPSNLQSVNFIMGILPGWWLGEGDDRSREPYVDPTRWSVELLAAGFSGAEVVAYDDVQPYHLNADIISRRLVAQPPAARSNTDKPVGILGRDFNSTQLHHAIREIELNGYTVQTFTLDDPIPTCESIISVLDLASPFLHNISSDDFSKFQRIISEISSRRVLWLTRSLQINSVDPLFGQILGFARTLRAETSADFTTLELDVIDESAWKTVISVLDRIHNRSLHETNVVLDPDYEYALSDGIVKTGRYHAMEVPHQISVPLDTAAPTKLEIGKLGLLQSLSWKQQDCLPSLGEFDLEVEPRYVGLNFRDVLSSMGIIEASKGGLGLEASGVVRKVGSAVGDFSVGDRVIIFKSGCFTSRMQVSSLLCAKIPENISDEEAATMPTVYSTVLHSLLRLGNLQKSQTVLIHSACGGVGLAAIQICKHIGAKIYVSAGNEEKVSYLHTTHGIPRNHIFHSRNASFLPAVMNQTEGRGVDIVLNSLSGDLLHASWKCVAPGGRFIELGKRDFIGRGRLSMDIFEANRSFFGVDLNQFTPEQSHPLLKDTVDLLKEGSIRPITPVKIFQFSEVEESFRYMQKGSHIGKVLVRMPQEATQIPTTLSSNALKLSNEKTYILVGGLGGLGRAISTWMIERGARNFIYLSRSAGSPVDMPFITELRIQGCLIKCIAGSVSDIKIVEQAVAAAESPIGGVLQMSMVLRDQLFSEHTFEDWKAVVQAKVYGTMNLHNALINHSLDFFVLFSSISGIIGTRGQSAYAAANTFLDSFVSYRHGMGLACSAMDIGMLTGIGYLTNFDGLQELLRGQDHHELREIDLLNALQLSIASNKPWEASTLYNARQDCSQFVLGLRSQKPLSDPACRTIWKHDKRMSLYHNVVTAAADNGPATSNAAGLAKFRTSIDSNPSLLDEESSVEFLGRLIGSQIYMFMMRPIEELDFEQSLTGLGIDSLVTIEIRNWWRRTLGLEVSTLEILGAGTIKGLIGLATEGLRDVSEK